MILVGQEAGRSQSWSGCDDEPTLELDMNGPRNFGGSVRILVRLVRLCYLLNVWNLETSWYGGMAYYVQAELLGRLFRKG
jgi:hypothetical protein